MSPQRSTAIGLRRLVALQLKEPLKYLEKNIPELQQHGRGLHAAGHAGRSARSRSLHWRCDRAFLADPLPTDAHRLWRSASTKGGARLNLIAQEVARLAGQLLAEFGAAQRKLKDSRPPGRWPTTCRRICSA